MLNRRRPIAGLLNSGSWLLSQTGRVFSGLVLAANAPGLADAARNGSRRADNQDLKTDDAGNSRDTREERNQSDSESDKRNDGKASAQSRDDGDKSADSGKHVRNESSSADDGSREQKATDSGKTRANSAHNAESDSDSNDSSTDHNDSHHHGGRHVLGIEQKAGDSMSDSPPASSPADSSPADSSSPKNMPDVTSATPANPNVAVDHVPTTSPTDLLVQGNDHVLASVSTSGGFAFARSGDVIAVSGPDGASIVQSGDVNTGTSGSNPAEPSDSGGNNHVGFES